MAMLQEKTRAASGEAKSVYARRAVYLTPENGFKTHLPEVPAHVFTAERDRALDPATGTAFVPLDLSGALATAYPATTPNMLARYARIAKGATLTLSARASGEAWYVLAGEGSARKGDDVIEWREGDAFALPGGAAATALTAAAESLLFVVTDEPALAWSGAGAPARPAMQAAHYPAAASAAALDQVHGRTPSEKPTGKFVLFTGPGLEEAKTITPTISLALNSLEPGGDQPPHRHNAVALTLCLEGEQLYSMIDGERVDWRKHAVMVTPPLAMHSHHNRGGGRMLSLVAQDGGVFYNARAVGFSFD
jgi:gentisate 1,2-dioxygenase